MKKLVIVRPKVTVNSTGTHSHYHYPDEYISKGLSRRLISYNRTLKDFLREQMWLIEGSREEIERFCESPQVSPTNSWDEADSLVRSWNPPFLKITDERKVVEEILKLENPSPVLDPDDPTAGINRLREKLSDKVKKEDIE